MYFNYQMHRANISLFLSCMLDDKTSLSLFPSCISTNKQPRGSFLSIYTFSGARREKKNSRANSTWFPSSFVSFPLFFPPSSAGRNEKNFYFQAFHQITDGTVYYRFPANKRSWFKSPSSLAPIFFFSPLVILVSWEKNVESMEGPRRSQILLRI